MPGDLLRVTYSFAGPLRDAPARAETLALEQSVELPRAALPSPTLEREVVPRIEEIAEGYSPGTSTIRLAYRPEVTGENPLQVLNLVFGNSALHDDLRLIDLDLPRAQASGFPGPRGGLPLMRRLTGATRRPMTCSALKPVGLDTAQLTRLCRRLARSGIDVIKDDHGLADQVSSRFAERVEACLAAAAAGSRDSGRPCLYVPNLVGTPLEILRQAAFCEQLGVEAVMIAPSLAGLGLLCDLRRETGLALLAHPALAAVRHVDPPLLLGTLFRGLGADGVIFPHWGGRFGFSQGSCGEISARLRRPEGSWLPATPIPAGGMSVGRAKELVAGYGEDVMLLVGGDLYLAGENLEQRAHEFVAAVSAEV